MDGTRILTIGLGLEAPWLLKNQHLDTAVSPHRLDLHAEAERGSLYSCPKCGKACQAHDFADFSTPVTCMLACLAPGVLNMVSNV